MSSRVLIILDADFGERLRAVWPGQPVWIVMSAANEPVIRSLWSSHPAGNHLTGITSIRPGGETSAEDRLLHHLYDIDLHHGPYSTKAPYTELEVIGAPLTPSIRAALFDYGFEQLEDRPDGFIATRSEEEARRLPE